MTQTSLPVLGVNGCQDTFHDASATLIRDGALLTSLEEERFNRIKHSRGIPWMSVQRILADAGLASGDIGGVGFYLDPWLLMRHYFLHPVRHFRGSSFELFQALPFYLRFLRSRELLKHALAIPDRTPLYYVRHHLCHAAAAYYGSPFENAAVLVIDGSGERETSSFFVGEDRSLRQIASPMNYPTSVGFFYEGIATHLGLGWIGGAGKLMGLAPFGRPRRFEALRKWFDFRDDGSVRVDLAKMGYYLNQAFFTEAGLSDLGTGRSATDPILEEHADLAASAQKLLEEVVVHLGQSLRRRTGAENLCYSGGVALNIDANSALLERGGFKRLYIMPAAYDGGTSIGAAYATHFRVNPGADRPPPLSRADFGTSYPDDACQRAMQSTGFPFRRLDPAALIDRVAGRLAEGAVVGWFRGRMEFGPRALGFRSILADPRNRAMADYVNVRIKGRETYRPFAPAVPLDVATRYFDVLAPSPFMLFKFRVRPEYRDQLAAITHVDGSARVQTVTDEENADFARLLRRFGELTGVPVLLNTSFNLAGEPLVETPQQATDSFLQSGMDLLVLNDFLLERPGVSGSSLFKGADPLPAGVLYAGDAIPATVDDRPPAQPRQFALEPSALERWMDDSIHKQTAAGFFSRFYNRPALAAIYGAVWAGNQFDRRVIRSVDAG